ncbi:MAG: Flp family type IVb pilin [Anaerolineaceae bacterium]|nr:Flp family type IVb pilin [Anaerolineaceae bacterium]
MLLQAKMFLDSIKSQEKGQGLIEYALIILLVSIVVILVLTLLGDQIQAVFTSITTTLGGAGVTTP